MKQLGKFEIHERIGMGGFGEVFKGYDPFIKRFVAVKTCTAIDEEIRRRFFQEAEIAGNLHHRNVTTVYDFGVQEGLPYLVQEYLTGEDLDRKIKRGAPLPLGEKLGYLSQIAHGLAYAHESGVVHRDVKPANIRILEDGTAKIMDFGIAKLLQQETGLTKTGTTVGTAAYLAPEQIRGDRADQRTDVFSFGVLAYELLTFKRPFEGEQISAVLYQILHSEPLPVQEVWPDCPPALRAVLESCLRKDPATRPANCGQVAEMLDDTLEIDRTAHLRANRDSGGPEDPTTLMPVAPPPSPAATRPILEAPTPRAALGDLELSVRSQDTAPLPLPANDPRNARSASVSKGIRFGPLLAAALIATAIFSGYWFFVKGRTADRSAALQANAPAEALRPPMEGTTAAGEADGADSVVGPSAALLPPDATLGADPIEPTTLSSPTDVPIKSPEPPPPPAPATLRLRPGWEPTVEYQIDGGAFTPLSVPRSMTLDAGQYRVRFRIALPGYSETAARNIDLAAGQELRLVPPFPRPASLAVRPALEHPNGEVWLNGQEHGRTPLRLESLAPGEYVLEVRPLTGNEVPAILQTVVLTTAEMALVTFRLGSDDPFTIVSRPSKGDGS